MSYLCTALVTTSLWAQVQNPTWNDSQVMGTIPNNGVISGMVQAPNPMDDSHNWVMTGNLAGGKHFRGSVPYRASGDLSVPLGSSSLDRFVRYSSPASPATGQAYTPYYSTSRSTNPGFNGAYRSTLPPGPEIPQALPGWQDTASAVELPEMQTLYPGDALPTRPQSPAPAHPLSTGSLTWGELTTLTPARKKSLTQESSLSESLENSEAVEPDPYSVPMTPTNGSSEQNPSSAVSSWPSVISTFTATQEPLPLTEPMPEAVQERSSVPQGNVNVNPVPAGMSLAAAAAPQLERDSILSSAEALSMIQDMPKAVDVSTPPQVSNNQILPLLQEARQHLQARHAEAALELYRRVGRWRPRDPAALAGQCVANLAQGNLLSSSLYLARWLEAEPESLTQPIDLARIMGGQDLLMERVADVDGYLAISEMAELFFLRAFINLKTGNPDQARDDISTALKLKPALKAGELLQAAIQ